MSNIKKKKGPTTAPQKRLRQPVGGPLSKPFENLEYVDKVNKFKKNN